MGWISAAMVAWLGVDVLSAWDAITVTVLERVGWVMSFVNSE